MELENQVKFNYLKKFKLLKKMLSEETLKKMVDLVEIENFVPG